MFVFVEGEVVSAKEKHGGEQGYTEDVTEKEHRVRVHPLFVERDGEGGVCAIRRGCKGSQEIAFDIGKFHSAKLQKMWLLLKKEAFLTGDIGMDDIRGTKVPSLNRLRITDSLLPQSLFIGKNGCLSRKIDNREA